MSPFVRRGDIIIIQNKIPVNRDLVKMSDCCLKPKIHFKIFCMSWQEQTTFWWEPSYSWSYGSWIYNYLCNQCLSPLKLKVWIPLMWGVLDTTLCDKVCQWLAVGQWFSPVSSINKTDRHDMTEILLNVALKTITPNLMFLSANKC